MCGIITFISKSEETHSGKAILNQYQDQYKRGQEGFGSIEVRKEGITINRATEPVKALMDLRDADSPIVIFHHRHPTSTDNKMRQTHPILVSHKELKYNWLIIHNGMIRNEQELFERHTKELNYVYTTHEEKQATTGYYTSYKYERFNDSESLAIELARYFEGKEKEIDIRGSAAFVALKVEKTGKPVQLYFGRNDGSPLDTKESNSGLLIASDINDFPTAMADFTFEIIDLQKYFALKDLPKEITNSELISKAFDLMVKEEEKPALPVKTEVKTETKTTATAVSSKGVQPSADTLFGNKKKDESEDKESYDPYDMYLVEREESFARLGDRVMDDIQADVEELFAELNYSDVEEAKAEEIGEKLTELLKKKMEQIKEHVRPHWDQKEYEYFGGYNYSEYNDNEEQEENDLKERLKSFNNVY